MGPLPKISHSKLYYYEQLINMNWEGDLQSTQEHVNTLFGLHPNNFVSGHQRPPWPTKGSAIVILGRFLDHFGGSQNWYFHICLMLLTVENTYIPKWPLPLPTPAPNFSFKIPKRLKWLFTSIYTFWGTILDLSGRNLTGVKWAHLDI